MDFFNHLKPSNFGAKSAADTGVFIFGAAIGGMADAVINFAGFAEPMVVAGFTGSLALGAKQLLWDAWLKPRGEPSERDLALDEISFEITLLDRNASQKDRERRAEFLEMARESNLDADALRRLWQVTR